MAIAKYLDDHFISKISLLLISVIVGYFVFFNLPINAFSHDVFGYYLYLPLTFKYHNLDIHDFDTVQALIAKYHNTESFYQAFKLDSGNWVLKYSMGMAIMFAPFYFLGDLLAQSLNYPTDGFSQPYQVSVLAGCFVYTVIGLIVLRKVLLYFFSDKITAIVLCVIVFGTNFFFHVSFHGQGLMSHNILFMLHAFTIWNTIRWNKDQKTKYMLYLGLSTGLSAVVRPTEIIIILFPLLYSVTSWASFKTKLVSVFKIHRLSFSLMAFIVLVIVSYQLFYWKIITGYFLFNSYSSNPAEGLNFFHPYILEVLFSFRKGWFIYSPLMLLAVCGFVTLYKKNKTVFFPLTLYVLINFYIIASWSCWWYASSYSSRALIPSYVFMAIPLGFFLQYVLSKKIGILFIALIVSLISLNIFQTWQSSRGIIDGARMTKALYKSVFLQTTYMTEEQQKLMLIDKYGIASETFNYADTLNYQISYSHRLDFEDDLKGYPYATSAVFHSGQKSVVTNPNNPYAPSIFSPYKDITKKSFVWVRASAWIYSDHQLDSLAAALVINMTHKDMSYKYREEPVAGHHFQKGTWNRVEKYFLTPDFMDKRDKIHVFFWNRSDKDIFVDDVKMEVLEPINDETVF
ncbi:MAG: hypothetical protein V4565_00325 [Bacteroidota bacterium]